MNSESHHNQTIQAAFQAGPLAWRSCDWHHSFPSLGIDLFGLKAVYAQRMARATCGKEAEAWQQVFMLLETIEADARKAASAARQAMDAVEQGDLEMALSLVLEACRLEGKWHSEVGWKSLEEAIRGKLRHPHAAECSRIPAGEDVGIDRIGGGR